MPSLVKIRRALLSVSDKADLVPFARALRGFGVELISTGGTAAALEKAGLEVTHIERVTGMPELFDGRVKTLHPAVHGALLARRDNETHQAQLTQHKITPIDLVCVNLYPFEKTIASDPADLDSAIEQIDIGGPALLRSAAKNHEFVAVVTSPTQYDRVVSELERHGGASDLPMRRDLAAAAFSRTAEYDAAIAAYLAKRRSQTFPPMLRLNYSLARELRYGENPHQEAALYIDPAWFAPSAATAEQLHGKELSYNNLADAAAALELVNDLGRALPEQIGAAIIKHTNPCGVAAAASPAEAFVHAFKGDPLAAYGGILAMNQPIDAETAAVICEGEKFLEVIIAPGFDDEALEALRQRWANVRLLVAAGAKPGEQTFEFRSIAGGLLVQEPDAALPSPGHWRHAAGPALAESMERDAVLAVVAVKHLKSNAIAIAQDGMLLGAGSGAVDRVTACEVALAKTAGRITAGSAVAASDAFFPFADGPETLIDAGVAAIVQPGGSKRDQETIDLCNQRNITLLITDIRHFRH
jgi:phosphoribosylaminoimidazolecarboxamide formyltransferase/IMP cyclohydrolase